VPDLRTAVEARLKVDGCVLIRSDVLGWRPGIGGEIPGGVVCDIDIQRESFQCGWVLAVTDDGHPCVAGRVPFVRVAARLGVGVFGGVLIRRSNGRV